MRPALYLFVRSGANLSPLTAGSANDLATGTRDFSGNREQTMIGGFDVSVVNWPFAGLMTLLAFVAALLGSLIAFKSRFLGAILAAILFLAGFVAWNYYPHSFGLPIIKTIAPDKAT